jgi:hypothetical protein
MRAIKGRHGGRLRRHGHWGHILTFDTPPHPRPVDIPKFPGVGASPAPLNPRTMYGLIAIIPLVSRSANNPKSAILITASNRATPFRVSTLDPPELCASAVAFHLSVMQLSSFWLAIRHQSLVISLRFQRLPSAKASRHLRLRLRFTPTVPAPPRAGQLSRAIRHRLAVASRAPDRAPSNLRP